MDRMVVEYAVNAAWQLPVLAAGAWLLIRAARPSAAAQYRIWVGVLALAVVLPLAGMVTDAGWASARVEVVPAKVKAASKAAEKGTVSVSPVGVAAASVDAWDTDEQAQGVSAVKADETGAVRAATWSGLRWTRRIAVSERTAEWVTGVYLLVLLLGLVRIARAWTGARRLVRDSYTDELTGEERTLMAECARRMGMAESATGPEVRVVDDADRLAGPVVVGAARPVLLCPEGFVRGLLKAGREGEATAALCHEMAHIRRRDYAMNLVCEALAAPLRWHPVTYGVERRFRRTREMACDAMAARAMESDAEYARCLVGLAERMAVGGAAEQAGAMGLFHGNALEERVMRLMQGKTAMSARARVVRGVAGAAAMTAAVALAGMVHVVPARAQAAKPTAVAVAAPVVAADAAPATQIEPAAKPEPVTEPEASPKPASRPVPRPKAMPVPKKRTPHDHSIGVVSRDGKLYAWVDGKERELTPAERARLEKQLEDAEKRIAAETAKIDSPALREQMEQVEKSALDAERRIQSGEIQKELAEAQAWMNSPEIKEQLTEAQKKAMADVQKELNSAEFQARMAEAQKRADEMLAKLQSPEFQRQMEESTRATTELLNNLEFQMMRMTEAQKRADKALAKLQSPELQKQMAEAQRMLMNGDIQRQIAKSQREVQKMLMNGDIQRQMADAQKEIEKQLDALKSADANGAQKK